MKALLLTAIGLFMATSANAGMLSVDGIPGFDRLDADGDGVVTREEANVFRQFVFQRLDGNNDGAISTNEVVAHQQMMQMRLELRQSRIALAAARLDADGDGAITAQEFADLPDFFALIDIDGDDLISSEEAASIRDRLSSLRD